MSKNYISPEELDQVWNLWLYIPDFEKRREAAGWPIRRFQQAHKILVTQNRIPRHSKLHNRRRTWHLRQQHHTVETIAQITGADIQTIERYCQDFTRACKAPSLCEEPFEMPVFVAGKPRDYNPPELWMFPSESHGWGTRYTVSDRFKKKPV